MSFVSPMNFVGPASYPPLQDGELRKFWKEIYLASTRAGNRSATAINDADTAVWNLIHRAKDSK